MKMKTSVILGVLQMSLGVTMKGFNALYFGQTVDFLFEFIPQICLLLALFGWMDALIIAKWNYPVDVNAIETSNGGENITTLLAPANQFIGNFTQMLYGPYGPNNSDLNPEPPLYSNKSLSGSPSVITTMINIFLKSAESDQNITYEVIPGQSAISLTLLAIAFISVPLMLCVKPCYLLRAHKKHAAHDVSHNPDRSSSAASDKHTSGHVESSSLLEGKMLGSRSN